MNTTTTVQNNPDSSSIDAGIAAARRVKHLAPVARDAINDPETLEGDELSKAVVKALYEIHPHIRFEDALELAVIVESPPTDSSMMDAIEHVVADVCSHLDKWNRFDQSVVPGQA